MLLLWGPIKAPLKINCAPLGGGVLPYERLIGCAAVWGLIFPTGLTKMGSIIGHRIDYNGVGAPLVGKWYCAYSAEKYECTMKNRGRLISNTILPAYLKS